MVNKNRGTSRVALKMRREPGRNGGAMNGESLRDGFFPHARGAAGVESSQHSAREKFFPHARGAAGRARMADSQISFYQLARRGAAAVTDDKI